MKAIDNLNKMEVIVLPQALKLNASKRIHAFHYKTKEDTPRTKINLSQNAISFLRTGTKEIMGDDKSVLINDQKFVVMKSGNCLMTEKISNTNKMYKSILLFFADDLVIDFLERNKLYAKVKQSQKSFYVFQYDTFIHNFVESLEKILSLPKALQEKILKAKFEEIMLYLVHQHGAAFLNKIIYRTDNSTNRLSNIVENNKLNKLSLQELAFLSNMSLSTFKREFFKQYQQTPIKWFNEARLAHIALLLRTQRKRPIELYEEAGYESFSNFVQAFKKKFGLTPKQYQKES